MKLVFTTIIALLTSNIFSLNIYSNDLLRLDSVITSNGHYKKQHKEALTSGEFGTIQTDGFVWDGSQWDESYTIDYVYDSNGNLLSEIKTMKGSPQYVERKNIFSYDSNNNFLSEEFFLCNSATQLIGVGKYSYVYGSNQTINEVIQSTWDIQTSSWVESARYEYKYDSNENQILIEVWAKSFGFAKWEKSTKTERIFTPSNILTEESIFKGVSEDWVKVAKTVNSLNADNTIKQINLYKNDGTNQWVNSGQKTYEWIDNKIQAINEEIWDGSKWVPHTVNNYTYNGSNLSSIKSSIKKGDDSWTAYMEKIFSNNIENKSTEYYSYSPLGVKSGIKKDVQIKNSNSSIDESFTWQDEAWTSQQKSTILFDTESQISSIEKTSNNQEYIKTTFEYLPDGRIFTELTYDWFRGDWGLGKHVQYYYADTITGIEKPQNTPLIRVFTERDRLSIISESPVKNVKIYTITGELIYNGPESQINTSSWIKGAYIVNVVVRSNAQKATKVLIN